jgi:competence protein ComEC
MWSFVFLLLGVSRSARLVLLLPIVAAYVVLTGASPSIMRAGVAGCMACLAALVSRPSDGWLLWLMPGAALLTLNPYTLLDVAFSSVCRRGGSASSRRLTDICVLPGRRANRSA